MIAQKLENNRPKKIYGVKSGGGNSVKDVDLTKRIVTGIFNTYYWLDSYNEMLVPGVAKKTINDSGPLSNAVAKIKHQADHKLDTNHVVGKLQVLKEMVIDGKNVMYFESKIPNTDKGNDHLMNYQDGIYDNHSIGYRELSYNYCAKESVNTEHVSNWNKYYDFVINKEQADKYGWFYTINEIQLFEGSVVMFGANSLTPYLGSKSKKKESVQFEHLQRIQRISNMLKNGKLTDEGFKTLQMELYQYEQILTETEFLEPTAKTTHIEPVQVIPESNFNRRLIY